MLLKYSTTVQGLTSIFFQYRNDVDIYTEDKPADKEFYTTLFNRLLAGTNVIINDITPLGCRDNVLEKCKKDSEAGSSRKRVYIVDSDIFLIYGNDSTIYDEVYPLGYYCIENVLLDLDGVLEVLHSEVTTKSKIELIAELDFDAWLTRLSPILSDLFLHYALHNSVIGHFELKDASQFSSEARKQPKRLDITKVQFAVDKYKTDIITKIGNSEYENKIEEVRAKWPYNSETLSKIVSGKDFLLPLVQYKIHEIKGKKTSMSLETFKMNLAKNSSLAKLGNLRNKIVGLIN